MPTPIIERHRPPASLPDQVRHGLGWLPVGIGINGRRPALAMSVLDRLLTAEGPREIDTRFGRLRLDPSHRTQRLLLYAFDNVLLSYERSRLGRYIATMRGPGRRVFVDVGANLGMYSLIAGGRGLVPILFEPEPRHARFLLDNAHLFGTVHPVALSRAGGSAEFSVSRDDDPGASSLVASQDGAGGHTETVRVATFSQMLAEGRDAIEDVRLVKIDVEGAELAAVEGMGDALERARPDIWCEVRGASPRAFHSYRLVWQFLRRFGYEAFDAEQDALPPLDFRNVAQHRALGGRQVFDLLFRVPTGAGHAPRL